MYTITGAQLWVVQVYILNVSVQHNTYTMYKRKVDVDMLNAVKSVLADVSSVSPSSEQIWGYGLGESLYRVRAH